MGGSGGQIGRDTAGLLRKTGTGEKERRKKYRKREEGGEPGRGFLGSSPGFLLQRICSGLIIPHLRLFTFTAIFCSLLMLGMLIFLLLSKTLS